MSKPLLRATLLAFGLCASQYSYAFKDPLELPAIQAPKAAKALLLNVTSYGDTVLMVGERGIILKRDFAVGDVAQGVKDNEGKVWTQAKVPVSVNLTGVQFVNETLAFVVGHDGVVLAGEAAHAFPPIGAQGLNRGLRDVADLAAALDGVSKLEKVVGENWRTRYLMGVALSGLGRWPEAATALTEARRKNPGHVRLALYLSVVQQELGEHTGSIATLLLIQEKHPEVPEVWLNQGISYQALGRSEDARTAYQRFLDLSSGRAEMQAQREWVLGQIGNVK